jgi:hypothetical protein
MAFATVNIAIADMFGNDLAGGLVFTTLAAVCYIVGGVTSWAASRDR